MSNSFIQVALKKKYKYRLIVEESMSIGVIGKTGRGVSEYYNIPVADLDIITGSLVNVFASTGGFCAGSVAVVNHQCLSSQGYCFSASLPAVLTVIANEALNALKTKPSLVSTLNRNAHLAHKLLQKIDVFETSECQDSPIIHLYIRKRDALSHHEQKKLLQDIVTEVLKRGILLTVAKYVEQQEFKLLIPSIRFVVSASHIESEIKKSIEIIAEVATSRLL
jgi:serine palmitoyltransferase